MTERRDYQQVEFFTLASQPLARAIALSNGMAVVVDEADYPLVSSYWWHANATHGTYYARATINSKRVLMHVFLMGEKEGFAIDHKNGNGLDNRRANLRWATPSQNMMNTHGGRGRSMYKGVSWAARQRKWMVSIFIAGKNKHLGYFDNEDDAARVYDSAALQHYGAFASLNFPLEQDNG